jgi:tetratricopeptide (TPR) repeat protein
MYERALPLSSDSASLFSNMGEAQLSLALKNKDETMLKKAQSSFQTAVKLDPEYVMAFVGLGRVFRLLGHFDNAIDSFTYALNLSDELDEALYLLGLTYLDKGNKNKALSTFTLFKQKYYGSLPEDIKKKLDDLIESCKKKE